MFDDFQSYQNKPKFINGENKIVINELTEIRSQGLHKKGYASLCKIFC